MSADKKAASARSSKKTDLQSKQWAKDAIAATAGFEYVRRTLPNLPPSSIPNKDEDPRLLPVRPKGLRKVWQKVEKCEEGTAGARLSGLSVASANVEEPNSPKSSNEKLSGKKQVKHVVRMSGLRRQVQDNSFTLHPYANSSALPEVDHISAPTARTSNAPAKSAESSEELPNEDAAAGGEASEEGMKDSGDDVKSEGGQAEVSD
ncbi:hypothetical protein GUITHDRAFT_154640 [Guillardia theta CCMP2712]|uniref:Uncharacterized protein n=2 Tax=Guillardia theta TaxID=55529 RepID=L1IS21_GUITC|nr:hypothetical protein GUITHDRAFT_154640 [Guillardia theta CCMP2712]EKX38625.1 hypothetical protein GUITHDRAFT_154640 [Guillardia theta CCMP2712]|eukprot:XP_005825605.1 hypothetical protein GUITHDRAFT_154640 [Guillardia theta CCMP2712]